MAALSVKNESGNRITLGTTLAQRLSSLFSLLVLIVIALSFVPNLFGGGGFDNPLLVISLLFIVLFLFGQFRSIVSSTTVAIDATARTASRTTTLVGVPVSMKALPFDRIRRVNVSSRMPVAAGQSSARPVWQLSLEPTEGQSLVVNSAGTHDEMRNLGGKIAAMMNRPLVDDMDRARQAGAPDQGYAPIQDFGGGGGGSYAPPVAAPGRLGRGPQASPLPEKNPPPNVLTTDSGAPDQTLYGGQGEQMSPASPAMPDTGMPPLTPATSGPSLQPPLDTGMPPVFSAPATPTAQPPPNMGMPPEFSTPAGPSSQPPMDAGMPPIFTSSPPMELPDQPPLGGASGEPPSSARSSSSSYDAQPSRPALPARPRSFEELQKAVADDPTDGAALYELGRFWQSRRAFDQAQTAYLSAAHLDPLNAALQNDLGVLYFQRGNAKEAEATLRRAAGLDPFSAISQYNLGLVLWRQGRRNEAIQAFDRAVQNATTDAERQRYANAKQGMLSDPILSS